jgi:hypothetical protein
MPAIDDPPHASNGAHTPTEIRLSAVETRIAALQVDLAIVRASFATKDDVQRILTLLHQQQLEFHIALEQQRLEFHTALAKQREDFNVALAEVKLEVHKALLSQTWKLYGFASLMLGGVYFIARYVH